MSNEYGSPRKDQVHTGWESIEAKLARVYPDIKPLRYGTRIKWGSGGSDPLDQVSIFLNPGPPEHWHYVSYGLTELDKKETEFPQLSGYGIELTFRLPRQPEEQAPTWPIAFMQNVARYVFETGNVFDEGHRLPLNSPILSGSGTLLSGAVFLLDPELGQAESDNGRYSFLQIIGTTGDELDACEAWDTQKFIGLLARRNPLLVTLLDRRSVLDDPTMAEWVREQSLKDGSSCRTLYVVDVEISQQRGSEMAITIPQKDLARVSRVLAGRLKHNHELVLVCPESSITLVPASESQCRNDDHGIFVYMSPKLVDEVIVALGKEQPHCTFEELKDLVIVTK
jgi:hypothetical protein